MDAPATLARIFDSTDYTADDVRAAARLLDRYSAAAITVSYYKLAGLADLRRYIDSRGIDFDFLATITSGTQHSFAEAATALAVVESCSGAAAAILDKLQEVSDLSEQFDRAAKAWLDNTAEPGEEPRGEMEIAAERAATLAVELRNNHGIDLDKPGV